jgi:hypothetical protein
MKSTDEFERKWNAVQDKNKKIIASDGTYFLAEEYRITSFYGEDTVKHWVDFKNHSSPVFQAGYYLSDIERIE